MEMLSPALEAFVPVLVRSLVHQKGNIEEVAAQSGDGCKRFWTHTHTHTHTSSSSNLTNIVFLLNTS